MPALERTFDALVFGWDGTAVRDRHADARAIRRRVEALCAHSVDVAIVSGTRFEDIDGQLQARPCGPGRLFLALNRGSELFAVDERGCRPLSRRATTAQEEAALSRAASLVVDRLGECGLTASVVSAPLNRRRIDLIPDGRRRNAPKALIAELLDAVTARLHAAGIPDLSTVVAVAEQASKDAGLSDPRITSDVKHIEIGLTDSSDSMRSLQRRFAERGIGPGLTLLVGGEFGVLGGVPGSDSLLLPPEAGRLTAVSVGVEPGGVPPGVRHLPGGPAAFVRLLDEQLRRRDDRRVPTIDEDPEWTLTIGDADLLHARAHDTLLTLGDGVVGIRGGREEADAHDAPLVLAAGVYAGVGPEEHLLAGPSALSLTIANADPHERRTLDLHTGVLLRDEPGNECGIRTLRFVAAGQRAAVALRAEGPASRLAAGALLRPLTDRPMTGGQTDDFAWARTCGEHAGISVAAAERTGRAAGRRTVERLAAYATDARRPPATGRAVSAVERLRQVGFERLLAEHRTQWARRWADVHVAIPDDPAAQLAARYALFQLWNNVTPRGEAAVGARGLSGTGYAGHVFWDTDVFVLPALATMSPAAARAMLEYRVLRLPQAHALARSRGLDGARFPWESASVGIDVTPTSGRANGEWMPIMTGQLEEHINADIAWAACHYAEWTGDTAFLTGPGRPLVTDTARYWASRAFTDPDGTAHIRHVIGPDEYHEDVDDNAYTNILTRWHLRRAAALEGATDETKTWLRLADALVDGYDRTTHRHEQFTGYDRLEPLVVADIGTPPLAADLLLGAARTSRAQIIKQPDVLMAHHLLPDMPDGSLSADLDFYLPRTAHGSSLSPGITAALLARAGRPDEALSHFDIALRLDLDDLTGMTAAGLHLATLAGVWHALLFGFAGVTVRDGILTVDPNLPERWGSLHLRFRCLRRRLDLRITHGWAVATTSGPIQVRTGDGTPMRVTNRIRLVHTDTGWAVDR